ncbi:MAG: lipopolysaccharide assembly LapA domain-containing protein [Mycobacterium sp.]
MSSEPQPAQATPATPAESIPPAEPDAGTAPAKNAEEVKFTRAAALWSSLIFGFLILIVLLIFVAQNTATTAFTFLTWHWNLPLGVAILLAAVCGGLITALVSAARMYQLRRVAKKNLAALRG